MIVVVERPQPRGVLTLPLIEHVDAQNLGKLLVGSDSVYVADWNIDYNLGLDDGTFDLNAAPRPYECLRVSSLVIGTPNICKLKGRPAQIVTIATLISAVLGVPVVATQAYKNWADAELAKAHAQSIQMDIEEKMFRLRRRPNVGDVDKVDVHVKAAKDSLIEGTRVVSPVVPLTIDIVIDGTHKE